MQLTCTVRIRLLSDASLDDWNTKTLCLPSARRSAVTLHPGCRPCSDNSVRLRTSGQPRTRASANQDWFTDRAGSHSLVSNITRPNSGVVLDQTWPVDPRKAGLRTASMQARGGVATTSGRSFYQQSHCFCTGSCRVSTRALRRRMHIDTRTCAGAVSCSASSPPPPLVPARCCFTRCLRLNCANVQAWSTSPACSSSRRSRSLQSLRWQRVTSDGSFRCAHGLWQLRHAAGSIWIHSYRCPARCFCARRRHSRHATNLAACYTDDDDIFKLVCRKSWRPTSGSTSGRKPRGRKRPSDGGQAGDSYFGNRLWPHLATLLPAAAPASTISSARPCL